MTIPSTDKQLTIDGREEAITRPQGTQDRLFAFPKTSPGQLAMPATDKPTDKPALQ